MTVEECEGDVDDIHIGLAEIFSSLQEAVNNLAGRVSGQSVQLRM